MSVSTNPLDMAARSVVAAAVAFVDSPRDTDAEGKDLYFSLESAVMAYRAIEAAEAASSDRTVVGAP